MTDLPAIQCYQSSNGARIYRIPVIVFPNGFTGYCHLLLDCGPPTLIDTGSGFGRSNDDLRDGLHAIRDGFGEAFDITDIQRILITHGHIDHFGGVGFMIEQTGGAQIGIHRLDRRVLTAYEERVIVATKDLRIYLERAGVKPKLRESLIEMYGFGKQHISSVAVDLNLSERTPIDGMEFIHTPGHCPGQVCIRIGDILLSADHILSRTTPHQAPEHITAYTGLGHYLEALQKVARVEGIRLALGGHEDPMEEVYERIEAIQASHERKLNRFLDIVRDSDQPVCMSDISKIMYPNMEGYEILMALEEVGAHVEYLYLHGHLTIANLDEVEKEDNPALLYTVA
jgi:glyoxylase-like metal-dependent hydrolase (beta-lactamase superfamily II)